MQREKLYKLQRTVYFIYAHFVFKIRAKFSATNFRCCEKIVFFYTSKYCFFLLSSFLSPNMFSYKKTKYTTRCSVKSSTIYTVKLIVIVFKKSKILCDQFSHGRNLIAQNFVHFESKKCNYKKSWSM